MCFSHSTFILDLTASVQYGTLKHTDYSHFAPTELSVLSSASNKKTVEMAGKNIKPPAISIKLYSITITVLDSIICLDDRFFVAHSPQA